MQPFPSPVTWTRAYGADPITTGLAVFGGGIRVGRKMYRHRTTETATGASGGMAMREAPAGKSEAICFAPVPVMRVRRTRPECTWAYCHHHTHQGLPRG